MTGAIMLPEKYRWIGVQFEPEGDPLLLQHAGLRLVGMEQVTEGSSCAIRPTASCIPR